MRQMMHHVHAAIEFDVSQCSVGCVVCSLDRVCVRVKSCARDWYSLIGSRAVSVNI